MTASAKRFIIYLLAEIGTEANRETRVKVGKVTELGAGTQAEAGAGAVDALWHVSVSNARVATRVLAAF